MLKSFSRRQKPKGTVEKEIDSIKKRTKLLSERQKECEDRNVLLTGHVKKQTGYKLLIRGEETKPREQVDISDFSHTQVLKATRQVMAFTTINRMILQKTNEEMSALADLIESRGHILLLSVKCHPEMAGCGVEFCWGISKRIFRKNNQLCKVETKDLKLKVEKSLSEDVLTLERVWKFERRTRTYMHMCREIGLNADIVTLSYKELESQMKTYKTHRNIEETERVFLQNFV